MTGKKRIIQFVDIGYEIGSEDANKLIVEKGMDNVVTIMEDLDGPEWKPDKYGMKPVCGGIPSPRVLLREEAEKLVEEGILRREQISFWKEKN